MCASKHFSPTVGAGAVRLDGGDPGVDNQESDQAQPGRNTPMATAVTATDRYHGGMLAADPAA